MGLFFTLRCFVFGKRKLCNYFSGLLGSFLVSSHGVTKPTLPRKQRSHRGGFGLRWKDYDALQVDTKR